MIKIIIIFAGIVLGTGCIYFWISTLSDSLGLSNITIESIIQGIENIDYSKPVSSLIFVVLGILIGGLLGMAIKKISKTWSS